MEQKNDEKKRMRTRINKRTHTHWLDINNMPLNSRLNRNLKQRDCYNVRGRALCACSTRIYMCVQNDQHRQQPQQHLESVFYFALNNLIDMQTFICECAYSAMC